MSGQVTPLVLLARHLEDCRNFENYRGRMNCIELSFRHAAEIFVASSTCSEQTAIAITALLIYYGTSGSVRMCLKKWKKGLSLRMCLTR